MLEWTPAAAHFDKVLRLDPDHADARHNLDIALKAIAMARSETGENPRELPLEQEGDDKQDPSAYEQKNPSPAPPGEVEQQEPAAGEQAEEQGGDSEAPGELGDDEPSEEKGTAVAYGESEQQAERLERETHRSTLLKARESAQSGGNSLALYPRRPQKSASRAFLPGAPVQKGGGPAMSKFLWILLLAAFMASLAQAQQTAIPSRPRLSVDIEPRRVKTQGGYVQGQIVLRVQLVSPHPFEALQLTLPPIAKARALTLSPPRTREIHNYGLKGISTRRSWRCSRSRAGR